ncbi:MAG TPA: FAD-monooxygenase, partial [Ramlibacter sp.]|nr:FAD-monooxygenase [Ramlibacter sp.]
GSSLYDHFGSGYTLLAGAGADSADLDAAQAQAADLGLPLTLLQPQEGGIASLYQTRYTLIRPDQHVAWRGDAWPADGAALLRRLTGNAE